MRREGGVYVALERVAHTPHHRKVSVVESTCMQQGYTPTRCHTCLTMSSPHASAMNKALCDAKEAKLQQEGRGSDNGAYM